MRIVITGGDGFIGKNLRLHLRELGHADMVSIGRDMSDERLRIELANAEFVFHLAGVNRPKNVSEFQTGNANFTDTLCNMLSDLGRRVPVVYTSSIQAELDNAYGHSKRAAEGSLKRYASVTGSAVHILRLPNVFGKWSRPNYNSAVATFCHNIARGIPIMMNDPAAPLRLLYIDDLVSILGSLLVNYDRIPAGSVDVRPVYETSVGEVAAIIQSFPQSRESLIIPRVGTGLVRALYSTYLSTLPTTDFSYALTQHADARGIFVEMLKTLDCGQFSYFTAHPGITRGEHYHHSKTEKFLVIKGTARFGFRHVITDETYELIVSGDKPVVVESVPGWTHNITNIGSDEMVVMLWANEVFDRQRPDTIAMKVAS